jgi:hypothetical protein
MTAGAATARTGLLRLVPSPVFILSTMRSGSTLLRCLLDSHTEIRAPHELHLEGLRVDLSLSYADLAMNRLGLTGQELQFLLWDRILHLELSRTGASVIVEKTPAHLTIWKQIHQCWPQARYIFLLRHPESVLNSLDELSPQMNRDALAGAVAQQAEQLEEARRCLAGPTVRYEELVAEPAGVLRRLCAYLQLDWQPSMLDYGRFDHGPMEMFLGDFADKIRSGQVLAGRPLPAAEDIHPALAEICRRWDY